MTVTDDHQQSSGFSSTNSSPTNHMRDLSSTATLDVDYRNDNIKYYNCNTVPSKKEKLKPTASGTDLDSLSYINDSKMQYNKNGIKKQYERYLPAATDLMRNQMQKSDEESFNLLDGWKQ